MRLDCTGGNKLATGRSRRLFGLVKINHRAGRIPREYLSELIASANIEAPPFLSSLCAQNFMLMEILPLLGISGSN